MKKYLKAFCMCFSMFCAIPTPFMHVWDESLRGIMLSMFPLVGTIIGFIWALIGIILKRIYCPSLLFASIMTIVPILLTGGIHLDGYMDCCDGIFSRRDLERRREILKDSHVGSFAVIGLFILLITYFGTFGSLNYNEDFFIIVLITTVSRANSALGITLLKPLSHSEYAGNFKHSISKSNIFILSLFLILSFLIGYYYCGINALISVTITTITYWFFTYYAYRQFDGFSGDVTGFGHTLSELFGIISLVVF